LYKNFHPTFLILYLFSLIKHHLKYFLYSDSKALDHYYRYEHTKNC